MFHQQVYPYMKALESKDGRIFYVTYYENGNIESSVSRYPGECVIDFCELDLDAFYEKFDKFNSFEYPKDDYKLITDYAKEIVNSFKDVHPYTYLFLASSLVRILNREVRVDIYGNDVPKEMYMDKVYRDDIEQIKSMFQIFINLQQIFREAIYMCLDQEHFIGAKRYERFIVFLNQYPELKAINLLTGYVLTATKDGKLDYDSIKAINESDVTDKEEQLKIIHSDGKEFSIMNYCIIEDLSEFLYFEFMQMMKSGRQIKICKNCGRYFVLKDKRKREYCDRIFEGDKTCKEIGAAIKFKKSLGDENDPLKIAHGMYNTMYSRMTRAQDKLPRQKSDIDISEDEFIEWSNLYSKYRKDYVEKKISGEEFLKLISPEK